MIAAVCAASFQMTVSFTFAVKDYAAETRRVIGKMRLTKREMLIIIEIDTVRLRYTAYGSELIQSIKMIERSISQWHLSDRNLWMLSTQ